MPAHTYCTFTDSEHTIKFAFNNLWRGDGSRSLSIFIAKREDGRAQHGNAGPHTSHLLVVWNQRVHNSQVYPQQTSELRFQVPVSSTQAKQSSTIVFLKLFSLTFSSLLMTPHSCLNHHLPLITHVFSKEAGMQFFPVSFPTFLSLCHLCVCLYPSTA